MGFWGFLWGHGEIFGFSYGVLLLLMGFCCSLWGFGAPHPLSCPPRHQEAESWLAVTPTGHRRRGSRLALHGAFVAVGRGRDLALLSLEAPLPVGPELRPLCLPYREHRRPQGARCWASMAANGG